MDRRAQTVLLVAVACALIVGVAVIGIASLGSPSYDSSCVGLLDARSQPWELQSSCGVIWFGTLVLAIGVMAIACQVLASAWLVHRGRMSIRPVYWLMCLASAGAVCCLIVVSIRTATYPDNPVRRGWVNLRSLAAGVAVALALLTMLLKLTTRAIDDPTSGSGSA